MQNLLAAKILILVGFLAFGVVTAPQAKPLCPFDLADMSFTGDKASQTTCRLTTLRKYGKPAENLVPPVYLLELQQKDLNSIKQSLAAKYRNGILTKDQLGGDISADISKNMNGITARYFVIHDTSTPNLGKADFPKDLDQNATINNLNRFVSPDAKAHIFVNRTGKVYLGHDFFMPWRATKFELSKLGVVSRGLFLHVELVQPRRTDPKGGSGNDALAPVPGFTDAQYDQLALLYLAASARAGEWLVPAFHAILDSNFADGHDDPQNFDLRRWERSLENLYISLTI